MRLAKFYDEVLSIYENSDHFTDYIKIGSRIVRLCSSSLRMKDIFFQSIGHLSVDHSEKYDFTIWYGENEFLNLPISLPGQVSMNEGGNMVKNVDSEDHQIIIESNPSRMSMCSLRERIGIYWIETADSIPWWEPTFSFRALFHWWTLRLPAQLIHGGGIAIDAANSFLITGPSGSGKSSTCITLAEKGYLYLGDDYVWIEIGSNITKIFSLYKLAKIEAPDVKGRFSSFQKYLMNPETYQSEKGIFDFSNIPKIKMLDQAILRGIIVPEISNSSKGGIRPQSRSKSLFAMTPSTIQHHPHHRKISYDKIKTIALNSPSYQWTLSSSKESIHGDFQNFLV